MGTKKKTKTKPKKSKKNKQTTPFIKKWRRFKSKLLQKIGSMTIFVVVFLLLIMGLLYKMLNFSGQNDGAQLQAQQEAFISQLVPTAQKLQRQYGILASVSLAQASLESNYGMSQLASDYYNLYGVKTVADDEAGIDLETQEFQDGSWLTITDRFKVYDSWEQSMTEHAHLIYYGTSWDPAFYQAVLEGETYQAQAKGLQLAGYATDPDYANKLIEMIESWDLSQYDQPE